MKRVLYLAVAALVAMLMLVPTAMAQEITYEKEMKMEGTAPLPPSGGPAIGLGAVALSAAALLIGAGVLGYAVLRRR